MSIRRKLFGNGLLLLGVLLLGIFAYLEWQGHHADPLMPALSALLIGCTAVLDRLDHHELE